jgi:sterol 3beta-glucosyltransferase
MRIVIFSIGTQGDVRPFVALGKGLRALGHSVCVATGETCEALVRAHDLDFSPLTADFLELMASDPNAMKKGLNPFALVKTVRKHLGEMASDWAIQGRNAVSGADLVIGNGMVSLLAASLAELAGADYVETQLQPVTPCPDIPPMMLKPGRRPLPGFVNLALYQLMRGVTWQMLSGAYKTLRRDLGLTPYPWYGPYYQKESQQRRRLLAYSSQLLKRSPYWPENIQVVGNFQLRESSVWQPPAALSAFLTAGSKPIYIGFGSMLGDDKAAFSQKIIDAIRASGQRAIIATGWGGLDVVPDSDTFVIDAVPHDWLFPRVALAVHHGGAGTTAAAARAGIPSVVIPFFGDQPFWAWCLQQAGVAPAALPRKNFQPQALADAIGIALSEAMQARARMLGEQLSKEDGVGNAIAQLQDWGLIPSGKGADGAEATPESAVVPLSQHCHGAAV